MRQFLLFTLGMFMAGSLFGQFKTTLPKLESQTQTLPEQPGPVKPIRPAVPMAKPPFQVKNNFKPIAHLPALVQGHPSLKVYISPGTNTPYLIKGSFETDGEKSMDNNIGDYFSTIQPFLKITDPASELVLSKTEKETDKGFDHLYFQQTWKGVPLYGAEAIVHVHAREIYMFNGRTYPTPELTDVTPTFSKEAANTLAVEAVADLTTVKELSPLEENLIPSDQVVSELVIYHVNNNPDDERLAWHVTVIPNITHRYAYFIDAKKGNILNYYSELCQIAGHFHRKNEGQNQATAHSPQSTAGPKNANGLFLDGPATANAIDLFGISRLINTYDVGGSFFLIDASRPMFNFNQSDMPGDPAGAIWTIDGQNGSPENNNFQATHVTSSNNSWNNPNAVSAHYHGGLAYQYFKNKFGRESINGQGGTIISLINITESNGDNMDNAFWNGQAMFYGNGDVAFDQPLAKAADVAGHEMSHGVIQSTANLEYYGESGALNESFADVFGAMIDPERDYQLGEDISNNAIFPTGALRDMANPNNGGSSLNDNGYQPAHYNDRYIGSQDNAGVHINSGIVNKAFHLFAEAIGKDKAEQVYYRALTKYLFKSALFVDGRIAVIQAAEDLYCNAEVNAAQNAFSAVGIGAGSGTNSQTNTETNPGEDFILMTDSEYNNLYLYTPDGTEIANPLSNISPLSRPSITDDGSAIVYIAEDNTMRAITIDWQTGQTETFAIQTSPIWRNVAISKDGSHLAALTTNNDNELRVYDYGLSEWKTFNLFNPTTGQGGPTTGDVQYADVLEWDFTGEWVMYDALNSINTTGNGGIEYWDISFANVWDNATNNFSDGFTAKLFNGLPQDVSVGNPTFSKNSDYVIAFDYIDSFNETYSLRAANLEENEVGTIVDNSVLSWPSYSTDDTQIVFDAEDNIGHFLAIVPLADDKINMQGDAIFYLDNKRWGVWFANGQRDLVNASETYNESNVRIFPNPVSETLTLECISEIAGDAFLDIFDLLGKKIKSTTFKMTTGIHLHEMNMSDIPGGQYIVHLMIEGNRKAFKVVKM